MSPGDERIRHRSWNHARVLIEPGCRGTSLAQMSLGCDHRCFSTFRVLCHFCPMLIMAFLYLFFQLSISRHQFTQAFCYKSTRISSVKFCSKASLCLDYHKLGFLCVPKYCCSQPLTSPVQRMQKPVDKRNTVKQHIQQQCSLGFAYKNLVAVDHNDVTCG